MKKLDWKLIIAVIAGLLVIISAVQQNLQDKKDKNELDKKDKEIKDLLYTNLNSIQTTNQKVNEVNTLQQKINELQSDLINSSKYITSLNEEIKNNVTGTKSKPVISLFFGVYGNYKGVDENYYSVSFKILNKDKYPMRGIKIAIDDVYNSIIDVTDTPNKNEKKVIIDDNLAKDNFRSKVEIETLSQNSGYYDLYESRLPIKIGVFTYNLRLQWLNGFMIYHIYGKIDPETKRVKIYDIKIFPLEENYNPLEYVEILPQFLDDPLKKYKNPLDAE